MDQLQGWETRGWISLLCDGVVRNKVRICSRCGHFVKFYGGSFKTHSKTYRLCSSCFANSTQHLINGSLEGLISYEKWDLNLQTLATLEAALLSQYIQLIE
jgi:hypothetical protein